MKSLQITILITIVSRVDLIINLLNNSFQLTKTIQMENLNHLINTNPILYWTLQIFITLIIGFIVYQIFKRISDLKSELKLQLIISEIRNYKSFEQEYKNHEFYLLPNESIDTYLSRSHKGIYERKIIEEMNAVRLYAIDVMKDKKIEEIDNLIIKAYDLKK